MKYLLFIVVVVFLVSCQEEPEMEVTKNDLLAYFPLDSSYADASGNSPLLQVYGNPEFTEGYRDEPSSAILLNGEDAYLVGVVGKLTTFSISMWLQSYRYYVGEWPIWRSSFFDYSNKQVYGYIDGVSGATQINCGIESERIAGADIENTNIWFHLYMAVSNDVKIYLNGSLVKTEPYPEPITYLSDTIYFGRASNDDEIELTYFYGKLDEIRIFNRILDQAEINELALQ